MHYISRLLQFFPKELMVKLNNICHDVLISDNNTKVDKMTELLDEYNVPYSELGPGTNRFAIMVDGYVVKIAMDKDGIRDNLAEFSMAIELQPFVTKIYECNGLMIVAEYVTVISKEEFQRSKEELQQILVHLSQGYLLGDVGTIAKNFMNWGYRPDGSLVILDFAYIYRVIGEEMLCNNILDDGNPCGAMLEYDENYNKLICPRCRQKYIFHEIRRRINKNYEMRELETIKKIAVKLTEQSMDVKNNTRRRDNLNNSEGDVTMKDMFENISVTDEEAVDSYQEAMEAVLAAMRKKDYPDDVKAEIPHFVPAPILTEYDEDEEDDDDSDCSNMDDFLAELANREEKICEENEDEFEEKLDLDGYEEEDDESWDNGITFDGQPIVTPSGEAHSIPTIEIDVATTPVTCETIAVADVIDDPILTTPTDEYGNPDGCPHNCDGCDDFDCKNTPVEDVCDVTSDEITTHVDSETETELTDGEAEGSEVELTDEEAEDIREDIIDEAEEALSYEEAGTVLTHNEETDTVSVEPTTPPQTFADDEVLILSNTSEDTIRNMRNELLQDIATEPIEDAVEETYDDYDEMYEEAHNINMNYKNIQRRKHNKGE